MESLLTPVDWWTNPVNGYTYIAFGIAFLYSQV